MPRRVPIDSVPTIGNRFVGRKGELEALTALLDQTEAGTSSAMVLRGEPGIGKTALLEAATELAAERGMVIATIAGIEAEAPLAYAALHRLLQFFPGAVDRLPPPQREALRSTLGLVAGPAPDRFLVGLGLLTLLADRASDQRLLTVIDDAQWLDPESGTVFGFAARRLQAEGVVMLCAAREADESPPWWSQLPEMCIGRLEDRDAADLVREVTGGPLSPDVQARLLRECSGNPLALVELARQLTPEQLAGAAVLPDPLHATGSVEQLFARRLGDLSHGARVVLAVAAAEPTAPEILVWSVSQRLGVDAPDALAELGPFAMFAEVVQFSHPLMRSVAYYGMSRPERRAIHRALAQEMDSPQNSDRVAWHLAMAATGPDESVARQLEQAAHRARHRGGFAATATLLQRAATLSVDERRKTDRLLAAAEAALTAARPNQARALLAEVRSDRTDERQMALARLISGTAFFATGAIDDAARELLAATKALLPFDPPLARRTLLGALIAAVWGATEVLEEVRTFATTISETGLAVDERGYVPDLFLFGFLRRLAGDAEPAAQLMRKAFRELERSEPPDQLRGPIPPIVPAIAGVELLDEAVVLTAATSYAEFARRAGALMILPNTLIAQARVYVRQGRFDDAEVALTEASELVGATGAPGIPHISAEQTVFLLCWRGKEADALALGAELSAAGQRPHPGADLVSTHLAVLHLSKGRYRHAFECLEPIMREDRLGIGTLILADFIEAAARSGELAAALTALERLATRTIAGGARLGLGRLARARALLADDDEAEEQHLESIRLLSTANSATELARSHLVFGEWLRRQRRRRDARSELATAHDLFTDMGAAGFAERARIELEATGAKARTRVAESTTDLTPQEAQVARLVAGGDTNREVAAQLFLSPATVEYHLRKVFQKLRVTSRTQLVRQVVLAAER
jgi:DNA-binding CsgD family transcriptional regulator